MATNTLNMWTDHFKSMAEGMDPAAQLDSNLPLPIKDPQSHYFTPFNNQTGGLGNCAQSAVKIVTPTQAAVEQARSEMKNQQLSAKDIKARKLVSKSVSNTGRRQYRPKKCQRKSNKKIQRTKKPKQHKKSIKKKKGKGLSSKRASIKRVRKIASDIFN